MTSAIVVHGHDGMDEMTTTGPTSIASLISGEITELDVTPEEFGISRSSLSALTGGEPAENAKALSKLLDGEASAYRDIVCLNAGTALVISGKANDIVEGLDLASDSIDSSKAKSILTKLAEFSHG